MDDVTVRPAAEQGLGVFARRSFPAGSLILEDEGGRRVTRAELPTLTAWEREHLSEIDVDVWRVLPEPRCYLNHACSPNAVSTARTVRALRDIAPGDEITIDYRLNAYDDGDVWEMRCDCGAAEGPHTVRGDFFSLPDEVQVRYLPDAPPFIQRMFRERRTGPR